MKGKLFRACRNQLFHLCKPSNEHCIHTESLVTYGFVSICLLYLAAMKWLIAWCRYHYLWQHTNFNFREILKLLCELRKMHTKLYWMERYQLGRASCKWDSDIKIDFTEIGCGSVTEIWWAWCSDHYWPVVSIITNLQVLWKMGNSPTCWETVSFSGITAAVDELV